MKENGVKQITTQIGSFNYTHTVVDKRKEKGQSRHFAENGDEGRAQFAVDGHSRRMSNV